MLGFECFLGLLFVDSVFVFNKCKIIFFYVSMSYDVGLVFLKVFYFDESINVSLNVFILCTFIDYGIVFDIVY